MTEPESGKPLSLLYHSLHLALRASETNRNRNGQEIKNGREGGGERTVCSFGD